MPSVRTVLGDVDASSLGVTYFHEHAIAQPPRHHPRWVPDLVLDDVELASRELAEFAAAGGSCLVDGSTVDYGRDVAALAEVSRRSGCHIVATAGHNKAAFFTPEIERASIDELEDRLAADITSGADGTGHRAGILKFGTSLEHMTPAEERAARAACRVQRATGAPLYTHTEAGSYALEQLDLIVGEGVDPTRVCIGHLDRRPDPEYLLEVARRGPWLGIDQVGKTKYLADDDRIELIIGLVEAGLRRRVLISGDLARRSNLAAYGGGPGLRHIVCTFVPRLVAELERRGFSAREARDVGSALLVDNPRAFLAIREGP